MKILCDNIDKKKHFGSLDLIPESSDDIYEISKIIKPEDKIKCFTHRKLTIDGKNQQKIGLYLKIKVESFNVDLENGILYAKGRVCEENEYVKIGSYHTLDVELDKKFNIYKDSWNFYDIQLIKNCTNGSQDVLFYIFYEKCCVICLVGKNNIKIINKIEIKSKKFDNLLNLIINYVNKVELIVICSNTNVCTDFYNLIEIKIDYIKKMSKNQKINLKDFFLKVKLSNDFKNATNKQIINFILTDKNISRRFNNLKYINDLKELSYFFLEFDKGNLDLLIGKNKIRESLEFGALEKIFFIDEIYKPNEIEKRKKMELFCKDLENYRVKTYVVPVNHFLGERLKEFGGVAGILKFIYN